MSKSNSPIKVLRVALRRIHRGWMKYGWSERNRQTGVTEVCLEGAIYGYTNASGSKNPVCLMARDIVLEVIGEKYPGQFRNIPEFNDHPDTTKAMVEEVVKTALIRAETGGLLRDTEEECYK